MEKVFDRNGITLYHGDCMELLPSLQEKTFPLAIVDPPYGSAESFVGGGRFGGRFDRYKQGKDRKLWDVAPDATYFDELFRVSKRQIIWGGNYFHLPVSRGFVVWDKKQPENISFAQCEYAWVSWPVNAKIWHGFPPCHHIKSAELCRRFHPTQKPEALYRWLLGMFAKPGETILDTHAGSCSCLVACHQMGFSAVGIELDETYCEKAVERLKMEMEQLRLFQNGDDLHEMHLF